MDGADLLLPEMQAEIVIADKAFGAEDRVILPLKKAGKGIVIPSKANAKEPRDMTSIYIGRGTLLRFFLLS